MNPLVCGCEKFCCGICSHGQPRIKKENAPSYPPPNLNSLRGEKNRTERDSPCGKPIIFIWQMTGTLWDRTSKTYNRISKVWHRLSATEQMISQQKLKRKLNESAGLATRTRQRKDKENEHERLLAALVKDGLLLQHAPENCRCDKKFVIAAVSQNGLALNFASEELKGDIDVVLTAVKNNWKAIRMMSKKFIFYNAY
jgi:hypothetical protein